MSNDKPTCSKCGSGQVYTKQKGTILVCRTCGIEENIAKTRTIEISKDICNLVEERQSKLRQLGIVKTPIEIADEIVKMGIDALNKEHIQLINKEDVKQ